MDIAKVELPNKIIFNRIKTSLNLNSYVECGLCGAIRVEAMELARVLHNFCVHKDKSDERFNLFYEDILDKLIVRAPDDLEGYVKYTQWKKEADRQPYYFLGDGDNACGFYDDVVVYFDPTCECFSKDKILDDLTD